MSLSAHDQRVLAQIEEAVAGNDPRFAASISAFGRLADGVMPERERIRPCQWPPAEPGRRRLDRNKLMYWLAVAMAVSITIAVIAFALASGHAGTRETCAKWQAGVCVQQIPPPVPAGHAPAGGAPAGHAPAGRQAPSSSSSAPG